MDEKSLDELLECSVCLERLDHNNKVLPCQHTFCKKCLQDIVSAKQELCCPECRIVVNTPLDDLPSNILLARILEGLNSRKRKLQTEIETQGPAKRAKKDISAETASKCIKKQTETAQLPQSQPITIQGTPVQLPLKNPDKQNPRVIPQPATGPSGINEAQNPKTNANIGVPSDRKGAATMKAHITNRKVVNSQGPSGSAGLPHYQKNPTIGSSGSSDHGGVPITARIKQCTKEWHKNVSQVLRNEQVKRIAQLFIPHKTLRPGDFIDGRLNSVVGYSRFEEEDIYETANSTEEYHQLLAEKRLKLQKKLEQMRKQRSQLQKKAQVGNRPLNGPSGSNGLPPKQNNQIMGSNDSSSHDQVPVMALIKQGTKEWHQSVTQELRNQQVKRIGQALSPNTTLRPGNYKNGRMNNTEVYARNAEGVIYEKANSRKEYHQLLTEKRHKIRRDLEEMRKQRKELQQKAQGGNESRANITPPSASTATKGNKPLNAGISGLRDSAVNEPTVKHQHDGKNGSAIKKDTNMQRAMTNKQQTKLVNKSQQCPIPKSTISSNNTLTQMSNKVHPSTSKVPRPTPATSTQLSKANYLTKQASTIPRSRQTVNKQATRKADLNNSAKQNNSTATPDMSYKLARKTDIRNGNTDLPIANQETKDVNIGVNQASCNLPLVNQNTRKRKLACTEEAMPKRAKTETRVTSAASNLRQDYHNTKIFEQSSTSGIQTNKSSTSTDSLRQPEKAPDLPKSACCGLNSRVNAFKSRLSGLAVNKNTKTDYPVEQVNELKIRIKQEMENGIKGILASCKQRQKMYQGKSTVHDVQNISQMSKNQPACRKSLSSTTVHIISKAKATNIQASSEKNHTTTSDNIFPGHAQNEHGKIVNNVHVKSTASNIPVSIGATIKNTTRDHYKERPSSSKYTYVKRDTQDSYKIPKTNNDLMAQKVSDVTGTKETEDKRKTMKRDQVKPGSGSKDVFLSGKEQIWKRQDTPKQATSKNDTLEPTSTNKTCGTQAYNKQPMRNNDYAKPLFKKETITKIDQIEETASNVGTKANFKQSIRYNDYVKPTSNSTLLTKKLSTIGNDHIKTSTPIVPRTTQSSTPGVSQVLNKHQTRQNDTVKPTMTTTSESNKPSTEQKTGNDNDVKLLATSTSNEPHAITKQSTICNDQVKLTATSIPRPIQATYNPGKTYPANSSLRHSPTAAKWTNTQSSTPKYQASTAVPNCQQG